MSLATAPSDPARRRFRAPLVGALVGAGLLSLAACNSIDAKAYNLGELHHEDGKPSYRGALMGDTQYILRRAFSVSAPFGVEFDFAEKNPEFVEDPSGECLDVLLQLDGFSAEDPRTLALRTEMYAWLATGDSYVLARERCVLELGGLARRLGVDRPIEAPAEDARPSAEEITGRISTLIGAAAPLLTSDQPPSEVSLSEACRALADRELDVRAGRRVLRTCAVLLGAPRGGRKGMDPVRELGRSTSRRLIAIALGAALHDRSPIVRAAAVQAWMEATDGGVGERMAEVLGDAEPVVLHRLLREVAARGIPRPIEPLSPEELDKWNESWLASLVRIAGEDPDSGVAAAACQALGEISGAGFHSLRFEEWVAWWQGHVRARQGTESPPEAAP